MGGESGNFTPHCPKLPNSNLMAKAGHPLLYFSKDLLVDKTENFKNIYIHTYIHDNGNLLFNFDSKKKNKMLSK